MLIGNRDPTNMTQTVRTRFAPSPTGYLHIGGARTALFNYLLARRHGGAFLLRIEDTDQTRNIAGAEGKLLEDLRWLGLVWDEGPEVGGDFGPYYQSLRLERYRQVARRLLDEKKAYYAFETREELDALRKQAEAEKRNFRYPRPDPLPTEADAEKARAEGRPVVVRLLMPPRDFVVHDEILGDVTVGADELDDFVLLKADGWPTYHFAVVIDDEDMRITHVLRGQEHLINTPKHLALQEALGFRTPVYAHLPIILSSGGAKMSKREKDKAVREALRAAEKTGGVDLDALAAKAGCDTDTLAAWRKKKAPLDAAGLEALAAALHVELPEIDIHDFRASGYLPEVIVNFIALLGWSPGGDREKMTLDEMVEVFDIARIGKTSARFDRDKLLSFNTDALRAASLERRLAGFRDYLSVNPDSPLAGCDDAVLTRLLEISEGFRIYRDLDHKAGALFVADDRITYDENAVRKVLLKGGGAGAAVLRELRDALADVADWSAGALDATLRSFAEARGLGLGKVAQPLRVAVTGGTVSPPIADTLELLGKERTLSRIGRALEHVARFSEG
ncbi:MAG: glutamate--tRNA ligase [Planctomycetota bacterium]|nr:MAG: glutamate--tRNA ligase [Planctomycetota bacterium]